MYKSFKLIKRARNKINVRNLYPTNERVEDLVRKGYISLVEGTLPTLTRARKFAKELLLRIEDIDSVKIIQYSINGYDVYSRSTQPTA